MVKKKGQTWSLETYVAIGIFLIAIIFFYGLLTTKGYESNIEVEVEKISKALMGGDELKDGQISEEELQNLMNMDCDDLKTRFGTDKEICIYFKDSEGHLLTNGTHTVFGIGCPGVNITGRRCGDYVPLT